MRLSKFLKRKENDEIRKKRNVFYDFMIENGWEFRHLFMRGSKWLKDSNEIIFDRNGFHLNGNTVSQEEIYEFVGYEKKED